MNEKIIATCSELTNKAEGICLYKGIKIFVPQMLIGEKAQIHIIKKVRLGYLGKIVELLEPSNKRVEPKCPLFNKCGGCCMQYADYQYQGKIKRKYVKKNFNEQGMKVDINETILMDNPYNYRNKSERIVEKVDGEVLLGLYEQGTHKVVDVKYCYLDNEVSNKVFEVLREGIKKFNIPIYDAENNIEGLRYILIRKNYFNSDLTIVLINSVDYFNENDELIKYLIPLLKEYDLTIVQNINDTKGNVVLGNIEQILFGKGYNVAELLGLRFKVSPKSFFQINSIQIAKVYGDAIKMANISKYDTVLDTYCGTGTIGILASRYAKKVVGVEINEDAIKDANFNAEFNSVDNVEFYQEDSTKYILNSKEKFDLVFIDPPRKGCTKEFLNALVEKKPSKIIYISCNPETLARDINILKDAFDIKLVQPVDLFPQTVHIETVVLLTKKEP